MSKKIISFLLMMIVVMSSLSMVACDIFGGGKPQETTKAPETTNGAPGTESTPGESGTAAGTPTTNTPTTNTPETNTPETNVPVTDAPETNAPETNTPETEAPAAPLPDKTAEELFEMVKSYFANLGNRNMKMSIETITDGKGYMSEKEAKIVNKKEFVVVLTGFGTDNLALKMDNVYHSVITTVDGEKEEEHGAENIIVVDGIAYIAYSMGETVRKQKVTTNDEEVLEEVEIIPHLIYNYNFSDLISVSVIKGDDSYTLTVTGLKAEVFKKYLLGVDEDDVDDGRYTFDNTKDYTLNVVVGRDGNVISADFSMAVAEKNGKDIGYPIDYKLTCNVKIEFYDETVAITVPADADEYLEESDVHDTPIATMAPNVNEQMTLEPEGPAGTPDVEEKSAEEVYKMVEEYFTLGGDDIMYDKKYSDVVTYNGKTTVYRNDSTTVIMNYGEDGTIVYARELDGEDLQSITYCGDYLYAYSLYDGEEGKAKMKANNAEINSMLLEADFVHELKFDFSEFIDVKIRCEGDRYCLEIHGVTEEAYIREILKLDPGKYGDMAFDMAKEYYKYSFENYSETYVVGADGVLISYESHTEYSVMGKEEIGMPDGRHDYVINEHINTFRGMAIRLPEDADEYVEVDSF